MTMIGSFNDGFNPDSPSSPQVSGVTRAFIELEKLKPEYQQIIGQIMLKVAENIKRKRKNEVQKSSKTKGLRELGADKVVGLMKSQSRRRWYDQDKVLHKVYQDLFILEQVGRPFLSDGMLRAIEHLNIYMEDCSNNRRFEDMKEAVQIIELALFDPGGEAEAFVTGLRKKYARGDAKPAKPKGESSSVGERAAGMRVERD